MKLSLWKNSGFGVVSGKEMSTYVGGSACLFGFV